MTPIDDRLETARERLAEMSSRVTRGWRLVVARRSDRPRAVGPRLESPSFVVACGLALAFAAIAVLDPLSIDVFDGARGAWRGLLKDVTHFGEGIEILVASAVILIACLALSPDGLSRRVRAALFELGCAAAFSIVAVGGSGLTGSLIKNVIGRARPEHVTGAGIFELHPFAFKARWASFPSGHSITAGASAFVLALLFPALRPWVLATGVVVASSRILLEAHFPSDVIAGFAYGAAFTLALAHVAARRGLIFRHRPDGGLEPKTGAGRSRWTTVLAAVVASKRGG